ncbi:fimbrial protein [Cronobacter dublinensis]|uniref:fimbrial protein n=1 Tax=Cronobacter dublinensis TaxID=413497 RepID=UPI0029D5CB85|nr:fimbrial protein [Cronobacter dublinensis]ELY3969032.1 fimbrial protein [Cronobacter dublinensis]ELY4486698.1 fimbrial protein [Cronobacter dublinensis]ELY5821708.1 fimbrial protein [Cronobacter dublinensis]
MKKIYCFFMHMILATTIVNSSYAEQTGDNVVVNFEGIFIISTTCTVDNDQVIDVNFGDVGVNKVDGNNYKQAIPYSIDCKGANDNSPVDLMMSGTAVSFDNAAVKTSVSGLGIQIQLNGQPMQLNKPFHTTLAAVQSLSMSGVPVKEAATVLTEQPFTATATLTANYQ